MWNYKYLKSNLTIQISLDPCLSGTAISNSRAQTHLMIKS